MAHTLLEETSVAKEGEGDRPREALWGALQTPSFCPFFSLLLVIKIVSFFAAFPRSGVHACAAKAASVTQIPAPAAKRAAAAENRSPVQTRAGEGRRDDDRHDKPKPRGRPRQLGGTASVDDQSLIHVRVRG